MLALVKKILPLLSTDIVGLLASSILTPPILEVVAGAKFIFTVLDEHFSKMNLYFEDVCFMLTVEGDTMYGEVSQDCGRYKYIHEHKLTDLDKDVWRNWGSFDLLLKQYKMITNIITNYVKKTFYGLEVEEINQ